MTTTNKPRRTWRRRGLGCPGTLVVLILLYYGIQIVLRAGVPASVEVFAHRGGAAHAPENTLAAFQSAIAGGAEWLEFDVQMTKDGVLVVFHDETVDRTTNGTGNVADLTLEEIQALDAGDGNTVPTFDEVIALAKGARIDIFPETKSAHLYPGIEARILAALEQAGYLEHTIIQSFEADSLNTLHSLNPEARLCQLQGIGKLTAGTPAGDAQYVCPMAEMVILNPGIIREVHGQGRKAIVWFGKVDNPWAYRFLAFYGADGIISDDPELVRQTLGP